MRTGRLREATRTLLACALFAAGGCSDRTPAPTLPDRNQPATSASLARTAPGQGSSVIPGEYIVVLEEDTDDVERVARSMSRQHGGEVMMVYRYALKGFAARLPEQALEGLRRNPNVAYVEPNQRAEYSQLTVQNMDANGDPWGLDRLDQLALPLSRTYSFRETGAGVNAYIIDSGIDVAHPDFGGRAQHAADVVDGSNVDCTGHGTHVAGIVGSNTFGVAKGVRLFAVRVGDCDGPTWAWVLAGIDWVQRNHQDPAVVNISLGGPRTDAVNTAVRNLVNAGVFVSVAAGNSNVDACTQSPAGEPAVVTVAATDSLDRHAVWNPSLNQASNFGSCVDFHAPGTNIRSTVPWGTARSSGTSMASPHVVGLAAMYKQEYGDQPQASIVSWLRMYALPNVLTGVPAGTPNFLVQRERLLVHVTGPIKGCLPATLTYRAEVAGGNGIYAYRWERSRDGVSYVQVGTAASYSMRLSPNDPNEFWLRLTVTSDGETQTVTRDISFVNTCG